MWRFLKILFGSIGILIAIIALLISGMWWKYRSFVDKPRKEVPKQVEASFPKSAKADPFIGTGGVPWTCAYNFPGPSRPFGMMRLSPETASMITNDLALSTAGYFYGDNKIIGFSHTRLVGTGATDGGHFLVLPMNSSELDENSDDKIMYRYSHANELAYPGYYSIRLHNEEILVELTSTERVGIHRYTFTEAEAPTLLLDITHALGGKRSEDGYFRIKNEREIEGYAKTYGSFAGRFGGIKVYFAAQFSEPITDHSILASGSEAPKTSSASDDKLKVAFTFEKPVVQLKLAISHVSLENAWENLKEESHGKDFDQIAKEALTEWEDRLSLIDIQGGSKEQQVNFYTALYRSFQMPTVFNDVNGQYMGFDKEVHQADSTRYFTDMSIWDTFRTVHPLYNLIARKDQHDMVISLVNMAKQGGWLPRWPSGHGYTNSMLGTASDIVISEAYQKGIRDFDVEFAYENMKEMALRSTPKGAAFSGREGNDDCRLYGYCPADSMNEAVSRTLEFAWSDYSISLLANELGKEDDAKMLFDLSMNYKNTWNPATQYFHPRNADGSFSDKFKPLLLTYVDGDKTYTNDYVEGSAMQWRWAPFFDAEGLMGLFESRDYFISELDMFFEKSDKHIGYWYPGSYYWHGNEPDIHSAYLFNVAERPDLTQKWVRWLLENKYSNRYDGIDGNDDAATLSAWYIFNALGFYPVAGTDIYELGAPLFEKATIDIEGHKLTVVAENYAPDHIYVERVWLNDVLLNRTWIRHEDIENGGELRFGMSKTPVL